MSRDQRWSTLLDQLAADGRLRVIEAAKALSVSQAAIRRDLDRLAEQQRLTRTRGGAIVNHVSYDLPLRYETARHAPEKRRIGVAAAALVKEFLDFAYQDQWQLKFNNEYDLLPATATGDQAFGQQHPVFASYMTNIANSVNYPAKPNWTTVENQIKQTMGQAVTGSPSSVLGALQQTASSTSS